LFVIITDFTAQTTIKIDPKIKLKNKKDRAKVLHYKSIKLYEEGNVKKAKQKLKKAIRIDITNEYLIDLILKSKQ